MSSSSSGTVIDDILTTEIERLEDHDQTRSAP